MLCIISLPRAKCLSLWVHILNLLLLQTILKMRNFILFSLLFFLCSIATAQIATVATPPEFAINTGKPFEPPLSSIESMEAYKYGVIFKTKSGETTTLRCHTYKKGSKIYRCRVNMVERLYGGKTRNVYITFKIPIKDVIMVDRI